MHSRYASSKANRPDFATVRLVRTLINGSFPIHVPTLGWITNHADLSPDDRDEVSRYFLWESAVIREFIANQGLARLPGPAGDGASVNWIDRYLLQSPTGRSISNRTSRVVAVLENIMSRRAPEDDGTFKIVCLDPCAACEIMQGVLKLRLHGAIDAECVVTDTELLKEYRKYARKNAISGMNFVAANDPSASHRKGYFDAGMLMGALSSLSAAESVSVLRKMKPLFKKGGTLLVSNVTYTMNNEDPTVCYILDQFAGVKLRYKTRETLQNIFEEAGYTWDGAVCDEPRRFHSVGMGIIN